MHIIISLQQLDVSQLVRMEELALLQALVGALALDLQEAYVKQVYMYPNSLSSCQHLCSVGASGASGYLN